MLCKTLYESGFRENFERQFVNLGRAKSGEVPDPISVTLTTSGGVKEPNRTHLTLEPARLPVHVMSTMNLPTSSWGIRGKIGRLWRRVPAKFPEIVPIDCISEICILSGRVIGEFPGIQGVTCTVS